MKEYINKKLHCYVKWLHEFFMPFFVLIKTMVASHSQLQIEMVRLSIVHINLRTLKSAGALTLSNPEGWGYGEAREPLLSIFCCFMVGSNDDLAKRNSLLDINVGTLNQWAHWIGCRLWSSQKFCQKYVIPSVQIL